MTTRTLVGAFVFYTLALLGGAFGVSVAVFEWRDASPDATKVSELEGRLDSVDTKLSDLNEQISSLASDVREALATPTPIPTPAPIRTPTPPEVSLTVNSGLEFEDIPSRVVVVDITIENEGATEFFHSTTQFRAIDSEGFTHSSEPPVFSTGVPRGYLLPPLFEGLLRPGETIRAQISFRVNPGTQLTELRWRISESSEITFELPEVKLQRRPG